MAPKRNTPVYNSKKRSPSDTVNLGAGHDVENTLFRDIFYESSSPWSFSSDAAVDAEETEYTLANHLINASVDLSESQNRSDETHTQATSQVAAGLSSHGAAHRLKLDKQALSGTVLTPRNLGDSTAAHRHDFQKHHALRTRLPYQHTAHGISSGLLTPNTTPSTGGQRWTPPSAIDSCASGSSGSLFHRQPSLDTSPSEGLNPDTYASDSPWVQSSLIRSLFEPHRCSGIDPGSTGRFGLPTERQLFKSNHGLQYGQINHQSAIQGRSLGFRPMDALLSTDSQNQNPMFSFHNGHHLNRHQYGPLPSFSSRYCGKHVDSNASADHLLPEQNCALWLTNLPPNITYSQLLGSIRNFGRIWCTYINEPNQREHVTAAAKVVFFSPQAASAFVQAGWSSASPLVIHGYHIKVAYNRIKYPEKSCAQGESRVLIVVGHPSFVNEDALLVFFRARFIFQTDRIRTLWYTPTCAVLEFSFGSYRCQAQMGMMALEKDRPAGFEKVYYGQDPCEVGESQPENEAYPRNHGLFT